MNPDEKHFSIDDNPLIQISSLKEDIIDFTGNGELGSLLDLAAKLISGYTPESSAKIALMCVRLEAMAAVLRMEYVSYMGMYKGTTSANMKKNYAKEAYTAIDNLVAALKYMIK